MSKGNIKVQAENIFPIIKRFLYSDQEIFLRELVSNAVDACQKLKTLSSLGEAQGDIGDLQVEVLLDKEAKTLTVRDNGIGMTGEEIEKYIAQIAFSGAEEFVNKYKDKAEGIIGHFGLGFFSAFMVSSKVEVYSKSFTEGSKGARWICEGSTDYDLQDEPKANRGTDIILHLTDEAKEYVEDYKIKELLDKYCRFLPIAIKFGTLEETKDDLKVTIDNVVNNPNPLWKKGPADLTEADYNDFYRELYPMTFEDPLFNIHLNVDYPFNLTGVLYFPKLKKNLELQKNKIQLYSNQVFVTDSVEGIVPEFLMLLHGVLDSPDIPLNVSRSYLQADQNVKKISNHITKKVADKLEEIFKADRPAFEEKWESLGLFVKYGMMTDDKFLDKAGKFIVMEDTTGKFHTLEEYKTLTEATQKNKDGKQVILYTTNPVQQDAYIQAATKKGYTVVKMETLVDSAFINNMEMKWENVTFVRVDADIVDNLIDKQESNESVLSKDDAEKLKELFNLQIADLHVTTEVKGLSADSAPVVATRPEFMRRMKDMAGVGGGMTAFYAQMPDEVTLTVNGNHPIYQTLLKEGNADLQKSQVRNLADLALLSQGLLKGNDLTNFINRSVDLLQNK